MDPKSGTFVNTNTPSQLPPASNVSGSEAVQPIPSDQPQQVPSPQSPLTPMPPTSKGGKKKWIFIALAVVIMLALGGGFVFGYYLPNQPQNVWKNGLNRSGKALDTIVTNATQQQTIDAFKKSKLSATLDAKTGSFSYNGSLDVKFDTTKSDGSLKVSLKNVDQANRDLSAKFLSELKDGAQYPNVYFQVTGFKSLGLDIYYPSLSTYDGKWISIDENYWKTLGVTPEQAQKSQTNKISSEDIATSARQVTATTSQYMLTSDPNKAVFEQKKFVGKEKVDGINTYHYQVGVNKAHAKDACSAIITAAYNTPVYKKLSSTETVNDDYKKKDIKDCQESVDRDIKDSETFDLWMDAKYKLVYKIRVTDDKFKDTYTDIGQNYKGDNQISLFTNYHNGQDKSDVKFNMLTDVSTHKTTGNLELSGGGGREDTYHAKITLTTEPYNGDIQVSKPAGAIPIEQVLKSLNLSQF